MTWSISAQGHHGSTDWRAEEHELLRAFADACEADSATITSSFSFNGNHVQATSLRDAREKLAAYDSHEDNAAIQEEAVTRENAP